MSLKTNPDEVMIEEELDEEEDELKGHIETALDDGDGLLDFLARVSEVLRERARFYREGPLGSVGFNKETGRAYDVAAEYVELAKNEIEARWLG